MAPPATRNSRSAATGSTDVGATYAVAAAPPADIVPAGRRNSAGAPMQVGASTQDQTPGLVGASIIREIVASGIDFVVSVPDITTSEGLLRPLAHMTKPRLIRIC